MSEQDKDKVCQEYGCPRNCACCPIWGIITEDVEVGELNF